MHLKSILRNYWVLIILLLAGGIYDILSGYHFTGVILLVLISCFILSLGLAKKHTLIPIKTLVCLSAVVILQIVTIINEGFSIIRFISIPFFLFLISIYSSKNGLIKIQELRGDAVMQNVFIFVASTCVCLAVFMKGPSDILEQITIIVSGVFSLITAWFMLYDFKEK
jgi:hypothetical protein